MPLLPGVGFGDADADADAAWELVALSSQSEVAETLDENEPRREPSTLLSRSFRTLATPPFGLLLTLPLTPPLLPIKPMFVLPGLRAFATTPVDAEGAFDEAPFDDEPVRISSKRGGRGRICVRSYRPHLLQTCRNEKGAKI